MEKEDEEENTQHRFILKAKILNFIIFICIHPGHVL